MVIVLDVENKLLQDVLSNDIRHCIVITCTARMWTLETYQHYHCILLLRFVVIHPNKRLLQCYIPYLSKLSEHKLCQLCVVVLSWCIVLYRPIPKT